MSVQPGMRPPVLRLHTNELVVDSFAGGGGASLGIEWALGRSPDIAINHDAEALRMHALNHPGARHFCENAWDVDPVAATQGRPVGLMWLSPDCKHFSKAKGGKPVDKNIRGLAWIAVKWAKQLGRRAPRVIVLENVEEFQDWGPLLEDGRPCPTRKGLTFRRFVRALEKLGYEVEYRELVAADYGSPTTRKRLFLIARCDGLPIIWPEATHGKGRAQPWRTAAECIEWHIPCPSIFERLRPLAENTLKRIARGIRKYVIDTANPFIVPVAHAGDVRAHSIDEPMRTVTGAHRGEHALVAPSLIRVAHGERDRSGKKRGRGEHECEAPLPTVTASNDFALTGATLIQTSWGEREGQAPRVPHLTKPLGTIMAQGIKHALVGAFLAKHYGGFYDGPGAPLTGPAHTITDKDHHGLVASSLVKLKGTCKDGQPVDTPLHTIQASGNHFAEVRAFLTQYYGDGGGQEASVLEPARTIRSHDCLGLVTVEGEQYSIADIGMRMLQPRELFRAQGFPDSYLIEQDAEGEPFTKSAQVKMCGNSVCPPLAAAIVRAQFQAVAVEGVA